MAFFGDSTIWTNEELKKYLKQAELALMKGATSLTFQGEQVVYRSINDLKNVVQMIRDELARRGAIDESGSGGEIGTVKKIVMRSPDSGFGNG